VNERTAAVTLAGVESLKSGSSKCPGLRVAVRLNTAQSQTAEEPNLVQVAG